MKKYIIFDFDGTLANTNDIIVASWQATFEHFLGHSMPVREIEATFGEILVNTIGRLIPDAPVISADCRVCFWISQIPEGLSLSLWLVPGDFRGSFPDFGL